MVEPDIVVDKRGSLEFWVLFDCIECDWILEDRSIEIMESVKGKTIQTDRNDGGDGSHVQEGFGQRSKMEGLIYPGIDPERVMLNLIWSSTGLRARKKLLWKEEKLLRRKDPCFDAALQGW